MDKQKAWKGNPFLLFSSTTLLYSIHAAASNRTVNISNHPMIMKYLSGTTFISAIVSLGFGLLFLASASTARAQDNVNATLQTTGAVANWGDNATWADGSFPNATDATVAISGTFGASNLTLDIEDSINVAQTYTVGDFSFNDTNNVRRSLVLQNGTLIIDTTDNTALWQNLSANSGGATNTTISLMSTLALQSASDQTVTFSVENPANVETGTTTGPAISFDGVNLTNFLGTAVFAKGLFRTLNNVDALPTSNALTLGAATDAAYLSINSGSSTVGARTQSVAALNGNAESFVHGNHATNEGTLTILGTADGTFAGTIGTNGNVGFTPAGINIVKNGAGTQTFSGNIVTNGADTGASVDVNDGTLILSGNNTYGGGTTVDGGILLANNTGATSATGTGTVSVSATGRLGGTGAIITSELTVAGNSATNNIDLGTDSTAADFDIELSGTGNASFASGAQLRFELGAPGTSDLIDFTGMGDASLVTFNNNVVNFSNLGGLAIGTYTLFTFDGVGQADNYTGNLEVGSGLGSFSGSFFIYNANSIQLEVVPEPSTWALLAFSLTSVMVLRRRRKD